MVRVVFLDVRERPGLSHDGKTYLVTRKQPSSPLPRHGTEFDIVTMVFRYQGIDRISCAIIIRVLGLGIGNVGIDFLSRGVVGHGGAIKVTT